MAEVYLAQGKTEAAPLVAIKRLQRELLFDPVFVSAAVREVRRASRISDPHVARPLDTLLIEGRELLFVMEHVPGETLASLAGVCFRSRERMPLGIAVGIVCGVLRGLSAAHQWCDGDGPVAPIVHRGLSPQNILVGVDGLARVFDFGLAGARAAAPASTIRYANGKACYMAPEQILREPVDGRADIYAAAVILWELVTGERLFHDTGQAAIARQITSHRIPPPSEMQSDVPVVLDAILMQALQRSPAQRFATADELATALQAAVAPTSAEEIGVWMAGLARERLREKAELAAAIASVPLSAAPADDADLTVAPPDEPVSPPPWADPAPPAGEAPLPAARTRRRGRVVGWAAAAAVVPLVTLIWALRVGSGPAVETAVAPERAPTPAVARPAAAPVLRETPPPQPAAARRPGASVRVRGPRRVLLAAPRVVAKPAPSPVAEPTTCDPPYTIDADGIKRVKRLCLRP